jgi:hypothetical protein
METTRPPNNTFSVRWKFKNDHIWEKAFDTVELRDSFINSVGLLSHPDIVRITLVGNYSSIKDVVIKDTSIKPIVHDGDNMGNVPIGVPTSPFWTISHI